MNFPYSPASTLRYLLLTFFIIAAAACDKQELTSDQKQNAVNQATQSEPAITKTLDIDTTSASQALFDYGSKSLGESLSSAQKLAREINAFLDQPNADSLAAAQTQWHKSLIDYRKFSAPSHISIADSNRFSKMNRLDYQIAAFPIQPGYLDSFGPHKYSGIVHDVGMPLSQKGLAEMHGLTDLGEAVLGFYTIEFMLFNRGQARAPSDFAAIDALDEGLRERGFEKAEEAPNNRRRKLLKLQALLLVENLAELLGAWESEGAESIRGTWDALDKQLKVAIAQNAMRSALTSLMLEIGELNSKKTEEDFEQKKVSPAIKNGDFTQHQGFIQASALSLTALSGFHEKEKEALLVDTFASINELTSKQSLAENRDPQDHWREVFALVKKASDASAADNKLQ